jgi:hypothetical protein
MKPGHNYVELYEDSDANYTSSGMLSISPSREGYYVSPHAASAIANLVSLPLCYPQDTFTKLYPIFAVKVRKDTLYVSKLHNFISYGASYGYFCMDTTINKTAAIFCTRQKMWKNYWGPVNELAPDKLMPSEVAIEALVKKSCTLYWSRAYGNVHACTFEEFGQLSNYMHTASAEIPSTDVYLLRLPYEEDEVYCESIVGGRVKVFTDDSEFIFGYVRDYIHDTFDPSDKRLYLVIQRLRLKDF